MLASPLVIACAIAASTQRVKIGIAVQVLPLSHPCASPRTSRPSIISPADGWSSASGGAGLPGHYHGLQHPVQREPGPLPRDPGDSPQGVDPGAVLPPGQVLPVPRRLHLPKPYQKPHPPSGWPHRPRRRTRWWGAWAARCSWPCARTRSRTSRASSRLPRGVAGRRAPGARGRRAARSGLRRRDRAPGPRGARGQHHALVPGDRRARRNGGAPPTTGAGEGQAPGGDTPTTTSSRSRWSTARRRRWWSASRGSAKRWGSRPLGVDERGRPDPPRARAQLDAAVRGARGAAAFLGLPNPRGGWRSSARPGR